MRRARRAAHHRFKLSRLPDSHQQVCLGPIFPPPQKFSVLQRGLEKRYYIVTISLQALVSVPVVLFFLSFFLGWIFLLWCYFTYLPTYYMHLFLESAPASSQATYLLRY